VLAIYFFQEELEPRQNSTRWKKLGSVLTVVFVLLFFFYVVLGGFGGRLGLTFGWTSWVFVPLLGTLAVVLIGAPVFMFTRSETYSSLGSIVLNLGAMIVGLLLGLWYLFVFASNTYRSIPWATGGGAPSQVQLMIDSKFNEYVRGVDINLTETSATASKTDSINLLMVTDKEYVVLNPKGKAVGIPLDTVRSVLYEK
jgi:hypothetical protein